MHLQINKLQIAFRRELSGSQTTVFQATHDEETNKDDGHRFHGSLMRHGRGSLTSSARLCLLESCRNRRTIHCIMETLSAEEEPVEVDTLFTFYRMRCRPICADFVLCQSHLQY